MDTKKDLQKIIFKNVKPKWKRMWKNEFNNSEILEFLVKNYENTENKIYPNKENILKLLSILI